MTFSLGKAILGIEDLYLVRSNGLMLKKIFLMDLFLTNTQLFTSLHKMLIDGLEWRGLIVDYCHVFISCLDPHSDGTHSLHRIHWGASGGMMNFSKSVLMKTQTASWMAWGWVNVQQIFIFGWTIPLITFIFARRCTEIWFLLLKASWNSSAIHGVWMQPHVTEGLGLTRHHYLIH